MSLNKKKKAEQFITVSVKNYSSRKTLREHQNNILKEIYSPARNYRSSIEFKRFSKQNIQQTLKMEEIKEETYEDSILEELKRKKRKINIKDKRRVIKNLKRCIVDKSQNCEESLMNKINKIQAIADHYRTFHFSIEKDRNSILSVGWNNLLRNNKISRRTYESVHASRSEKMHVKPKGVSFHKQNYNEENMLEDIKKETIFLSREDPKKILNFTSGYIDSSDSQVDGDYLSLKHFQKGLKKNKTFQNLYNNVNRYQKTEHIDFQKSKKNNFLTMISINEKGRKVGRINSRLKKKMQELHILQ